jgi:hypothetical protein
VRNAEEQKRIPGWLVAIAISLAFAVLFGIGLVASSLIFTPERLTEEPLGFWVSVTIKAVMQLLSFNLAYFVFIAANRGDNQSNLMRAFNAYAKYVKHIYDKSLQDRVREEIKKTNRARFVETSNILLENTTESLHYDDLFVVKDGVRNPVNLKQLAADRMSRYNLTKKQGKALVKVMTQIINGKVYYLKVDYNEIMIGADKVKNGYVSMSTSEGSLVFRKNIIMLLMAYAMAVVTTIVMLGKINGDIVYEILSSLMTIMMAVLSALIWGSKVVTNMVRAYSSRRDFCSGFIELPPEPVVQRPAAGSTG